MSTNNYEKGRSPIIRNFRPGLPERGKIKIGKKGEWRTSKTSGKEFQLPTKLDHFLVTTMERDNDNNFVKDAEIHKMLGEKPKRIPVYLMYNDIALNFQCRYTCYRGRTLWCSGDGEGAFRDGKETECPCDHLDIDYKGELKCKPYGVLAVIIKGSEFVGGVWKFRTTSFNTIRGLLSSMALIKGITHGQLSGIPLDLTIQPKTCIPPDGKSQTVYVVGLEYKGDPSSLLEAGYKKLLTDASHIQRMEKIEEEAKKNIDVEVPDNEVLEEFYPEQVVKEEPPPLAEPEKKEEITEEGEKPTAKTTERKAEVEEENGQPEDLEISF